jgi:hypothetical protein
MPLQTVTLILFVSLLLSWRLPQVEGSRFIAMRYNGKPAVIVDMNFASRCSRVTRKSSSLKTAKYPAKTAGVTEGIALGRLIGLPQI